MKDAGMSAAAIAKDIGRPERTVRGWLKKSRPEAVAVAPAPISDPDPAPIAEPPPAPAPKPIVSDPPPRPAVLSALTEEIIKRERKVAAERAESLAALMQFNAQLERHWRFAQKHWEKSGRPVVRHMMAVADAELVRRETFRSQCDALGLPADATHEQILREIDRQAKALAKHARSALYLFGYTEQLEQ